MNPSAPPDAESTNIKLFGPYSRRLASDDLDSYTTFAGRFAKWLSDKRAYYPTARPEIVRLMKVVQSTLRRNVGANPDPKSPFHISTCIEHPMVAPYARLLKAIHPHRELFVEPELFAEIKALLKTITAPQPPIHIDLTLDSPVASPIHVATSTMQPASSSLASALHMQQPLSLLPPAQTPSATSQSQPLPIYYPANLQSIQTTYSASSAPPLATSSVGPPVQSETNHFTAPSSVAASQFNPPCLTTSSTPSTSLNTGQNVSSVSSPALSSIPTEQPVNIKVKRKKKRTLPGFEIESLIQADIQDLQKRVAADPIVKAEATETRIPSARDGQSYSEAIVLDHDNLDSAHLVEEKFLLPSSSDKDPAILFAVSEATTNEHTAVAELAQEMLVPHNDRDIEMMDGTIQPTPTMAEDLSSHLVAPAMMPIRVPTPQARILGADAMKGVTNDSDMDTARELDATGPPPASPEAMEVEETQPATNSTSRQVTPSSDADMMKSEPTLTDTPSVLDGTIEHPSNQHFNSPLPPIAGPSSDAIESFLLPKAKVYTPEEFKALHAFGPDMCILAVHKGERRKRMKIKITFQINDGQFNDITRWNSRKKQSESLSSSTCVSLASYSRASSKFEQKGIDEISELPLTWPSGGSLSMHVMYKGQRTAFPLSPPFRVSSNGMVDVSEYICLGENVIELEQFDDVSAHIFLLRIHHPTLAQLEEAAERWRKDKAWDNWLLKMAEPMDVPIPSFSE